MITRDHVMVDLETVDNVATSSILSIGAFVFAGPHEGLAFYQPVFFGSGLALGLTYSDDTMRAWAKQSEAARTVFMDARIVPIAEALAEFSKFLKPCKDVRVWGNGADFDNAILQVAYRKVGLQPPWAFWNNRCYRTMTAKCPRRQNTGTHHNAYDDAVSQAEHMLTHLDAKVWDV